MRTNDRGFSMIELMIVSAVIIVISTIAAPSVLTIFANYKLDVSGNVVSSLMQQARMQAAKTNQPTYVQWDSAKPNLVIVNGDPSVTTYADGNPDVAIYSGVVFKTTGLPDHSQLDTYLSTATPQIGGVVGFNARGLPCVENGGPGQCPSVTDGVEWFMQGPRGGWEAVTVTPAGRIKSWRLSGSTAWQ